MATNDDLTQQLQLTQAIQTALLEMNKIAKDTEKAFSSQVDATKKLNQALQFVSGVKSNFSDLGDKIKSMTDKAQETGDVFSDWTKKLKESEQASDSFLSKISKIAGVGVAIKGFKNSLLGLVNVAKAGAGVFESLVSAGWNIGKAILSIPVRIFDNLIKVANQVNSLMLELAIAMENLRKQMGDFQGPASHAILVADKTLKGFAATGLSTWRVFGTLAERLTYITELAVGMGSTFGVLRKEFEDNGGAILAYQKGLGLTAENLKSLGDKAISEGKPLGKLLRDTASQTLELGKAFDVDQKLIGKDLGKASMDVKHFGAITVKEIGQASVYARKLGVELDKITGTLDAFETFDTAAENAAKLSQSFGVTVDAFKLMEAQNPAEQVEMLRKQFAQGGVDASTFNRQQLKLIASSTGLDEATAKQVFSLKNQGVSLDVIKKKSELAEKKNISQAEAMARLAASIERLVKMGPVIQGGFFQHFLEGFGRGIQSSKEFMKVMMNIRQGLMSTFYEGIKLGREFVKLFPGIQGFFESLGEIFDPKKITNLFASIRNAFADFFSQLENGNYSLDNLMQYLQDIFGSFMDKESPAVKKLYSNFDIIIKTVGGILGKGFEWLSKNTSKMFDSLADIISGKKSLDLSGVKNAGGEAGSLAMKLFAPILKSIKDNGPQLIKSFGNLMGVVFTKAWDFVKDSGILKKVAIGVMGYLATSFVTNIGVGLIVKSLSAVVFKAIPKLIAGVGRGAVGLLGGAGKALGPAALIAGLAIGIGEGIEKYTKKITSTLDKSSKTIGAAATGVIDGLTLGLLPEDFKVQIANTLAKASEQLFEVVGNTFGKGFGESLKKQIADQLSVVGGIWTTLKELFTGDQGSFETAAADLGKSLLRFIGRSFSMLTEQLPLLFGEIGTKIISLIGNAMIKIATVQFEAIAGQFDKVFHTNLSERVKNLSANVQKTVSSASDALVKDMKNAGTALEKSNSALLDKFLGANDSLDKVKNQAPNNNPQNPGKAISTEGISQVAKQDIESFSTQIESASKKYETLVKSFDSVNSINDSLNKIADNIKINAISPAVDAIDKIYQATAEINNILANGNSNKIDISTKLKAFANNSGLGSRGSFKIENKPVAITVNLSIEMSASELEKILIMRSNSVIRDRLNYATSGASPSIPDKPINNLPPIAKVGD